MKLVLVIVSFWLVAGFSVFAKETKAWSFVSIPDFLNFDIEYPQEGWEDALGFIMDSMKKENVLIGRPFPPMYDWARISTGTMEEMQQFTTALKKVMT